jgi:hypothetical protein
MRDVSQRGKGGERRVLTKDASHEKESLPVSSSLQTSQDGEEDKEEVD